MCSRCIKRPARMSSLINGVYYRDLCYICHGELTAGHTVSSGQAVYNRNRDVEEHEADIRQPYTDGKPDAGFIHLYPEQAKRMFTPEELDQGTRG